MPKLQGKSDFISLCRSLRQRMTPTEQVLWRHLKARRFFNLKFRRQHGIGPYIVDFYCAEKQLVIEVDGDIHALESKQRKDRERERYLQDLNIRILRYSNQDVMKNLEGVLQNLAWETGALPPPTPSLQRRG